MHANDRNNFSSATALRFYYKSYFRKLGQDCVGIYTLRIIRVDQVAVILGFPGQNVIIETLFPGDVINTVLNLF